MNLCSYDVTTNGRRIEQLKSILHVGNHLYIVRPFLVYYVVTDTATVNVIANVIMIHNCYVLFCFSCHAVACLFVVYSYFVTGH